MRTLVISDLHLGGRLQQSALIRAEPLERLLAALDRVERLVLLGDVIELLERRQELAMRAAEPVLRAIGARLGPEREVVIVPGNHDLALVARWLRPRLSELAVDTRVPVDATAGLAAVASWLAPAPVRVHYPGVWLSGRVWATHGHYIDRRVRSVRAAPIEFETARGFLLARTEAVLTRALPGPLAGLAEDAAELARAATMPLPRRLLHRRMAPITSALLGTQMRRASIPALIRVAERLAIEADWLVFGHVHRVGPLVGDVPAEWQSPAGRPGVLNTGSWVYEPLLVHRATPPHPYWPGGSVLVEDGRPPVAHGLLDDLEASALHRA